MLGSHFRLRVPDGVRARAAYLAGSDERRADELTAMLRDPDVRAIVFARGGYGASRILDRVDADLLRRDPRPIVGFSDATALLAWAAAVGVGGIHGPMVSQLGDVPAADVAWLARTLTDPRPAGRLPWTLSPLGEIAAPAPVTARLLAGNLTMLAHLCGTPWQLQARDTIIVTEEVAEKPYAIDRDWTQLHLSGSLAGCKGVIVGDLCRCTDPPTAAGAPDNPGPALAAVVSHLHRDRLPGLSGAPLGHASRNMALPFLGRATVDFAAGTLDLLDAAVS